MKAIVLSAKSPSRRPSLRRGLPPSRSYGAAGLLIPLLLACFGLAPMAQAVGPDTDGSIAGSNNGEGIGVLVSRTTGVWNTGTGFEALSQLTAGNQNTATGLRALTNDINGGFNTATGVFSLFSNTSGFFNSATGAYSLANNISGTHNTANGYAALYRNTAANNTATGFAALYHNITGTNNTANGYQALFNNTTVGANFGGDNTAVGFQALFSNTIGFLNTANGSGALFSNDTGDGNTATGSGALLFNTSGNNNTALGLQAGLQSTTGSNNVYIGAGMLGVAGESDACYIKSIFGQTSASGLPVLINLNNKLGTIISSKRFKVDIRPMDKASEGLYALKPVTFHYKKEIDPAGIAQFGLVAEEVEKANSELVVRDKEGKPYSVRYDQVNAMLLNEFLKEHHAFVEEHRKVNKLETTVAQLNKEMETVVAHAKEQDAKIQRVSEQIELSKPAPQIVGNQR